MPLPHADVGLLRDDRSPKR